VTTFKLLSTTGDQTVEMDPSKTLVVGRAVTSDVPIYDPTVSRRHAELSIRDGGVHVLDLGSANGTFVNGTRITDTTAAEGDIVTFGKAAFKVLEVAPPKPKEAPPLSEFGGRPPPPEATIVRQVAVKEPGADLEERVAVRPSGASQLKIEDTESVDERQARKLSLLLDISKELSKQQDVDKLLEKVVDITFQVMNVDRVSILMLERGTNELVPRISRSRLGDGSGAKVPQSIARRAVDERLAILTDNAAADERFGGKSIMMQSVRSAMCTPLMGSDGKVLGIIYVDNMTAISSFNDEDLEFLIAFSGIAAVAIENGRLSERIKREAVVLSNFQRYFAPDLAEEIANQAEAVKLGGEKRPVVVFFSDIRGFTSMSENMIPDEIATLLTEYFTEMVEIVFEHSGTHQASGRCRPCDARGHRTARYAREDEREVGRRRAPADWDRHRDQLWRCLCREHRERPATGVHGDRRRRQRGLPPLLKGRSGRDPDFRAVLQGPEGAAQGRGAGAHPTQGQGPGRSGLPRQAIGFAGLCQQVHHQAERQAHHTEEVPFHPLDEHGSTSLHPVAACLVQRLSRRHVVRYDLGSEWSESHAAHVEALQHLPVGQCERYGGDDPMISPGQLGQHRHGVGGVSRLSQDLIVDHHHGVRREHEAGRAERMDGRSFRTREPHGHRLRELARLRTLRDVGRKHFVLDPQHLQQVPASRRC